MKDKTVRYYLDITPNRIRNYNKMELTTTVTDEKGEKHEQASHLKRK